MKKLGAGVLCVLLVSAVVACGDPGQDQAEDSADFMYSGADREARLIERAKREGRVVLYTSLAPTESQPLAAAFEKKYGINVELWRALSDQVVRRAVTEAQARRYDVDVIETNGPEMEMLAREQLLAEFYSPHLADLPAEAIPAHRTWFPDRLSFYVVAYNTNAVQRSEIPAIYAGFADPRWKGRIAVEATDAEWMATLIKSGQPGTDMEFFRALSALGPDVRRGHVLLANLVASGEVPVGLTAYHSNVVPLMREGAPMDYVPVQPVVARPQGIGVATNAPHPHAALLFADFVLSQEGQELFESLGRVPASTRVESDLNNFPFVMIDPATVLDEKEHWDTIWNDLFLRR
ncbi:MAG: extracellular solute-binding protein [Acidobacteria bacterium]|nr:extracellular solute-binding protein [Acidobacteriota bacterium]